MTQTVLTPLVAKNNLAALKLISCNSIHFIIGLQQYLYFWGIQYISIFVLFILHSLFCSSLSRMLLIMDMTVLATHTSPVPQQAK
jgi:hypothetical protein